MPVRPVAVLGRRGARPWRAALAVLVVLAGVAPGSVLPAAEAASLPRGLTLVAADETGMTVRFAVPAYRIEPMDRPEGRFFRVVADDLTGSTEREGRPLFPATGGLLGIPADVEPIVRILEETLVPLSPPDGREPEPVGRAAFRPDGTTFAPTREFLRDTEFYDGTAAWPALTAELGAVGAWRYQRVVPLRILPFRWDPAGRTLQVVSTALIRIDFVRRGQGLAGRSGLAAPVPGPRHDAGFEGAYETTLLNYAAAREFRAAPAPPVRSARIERRGADGRALTTMGGADGLLGGPTVGAEWRIRVDSTGVWRVTYAQLAARGFPAGTPSVALSLTRREYAADRTPAFVRIDTPIRVIEGVTGVAGTFDGDDAIVFYGQNWLERARPSEYRARFGIAEFYYLGALVGGSGARMTEISADLLLPTPTRPTSFPSFRRYERRFYYNLIPRDTCNASLTWTNPFTDAAFSDTFTVFTPDPDPTGQVRFNAAFQGVALSPSSHTIWMRWKRPSDGLLTPVFTESFSGKNAYAADTVFSAGRIGAGTNRIEWRGWSPNFSFPDGGPSGASLRFYEVTYDRVYRAFANALDFNSSGAGGDVEIEVDGFTASAAPAVQVYDVSDSTAPRALILPAGFIRSSSPGIWAAKFQTRVAPGERRRFLAMINPRQVPDAAIAALTQETASALWNPPGSPDYLLVVPEEFLVPARRLADHRRSQGFDVLVAPLAEVADTYDGGRRTDWAIRRFFEDAFARWGTRFGLLFGDGTEDPQNFLSGSERDWVPAHLISGPVGISSGVEISASDFWYVNDLTRSSLPETPCFLFETPDLFADMSLGRLPVGSLAQANGVVDRLIAYDTQDREGAWRRRMIMFPDDPYSFASFGGDLDSRYCYKGSEEVFERICDKLERVVKDEGGYRDLDVNQYRLREKLLPLGRPVPGDPDICLGFGSTAYLSIGDYVQSTAAPQLRSALNEGALVFNFQGHGSAVVLAHENMFRARGSAQDIDLVFNEGKPFFFLSFSCHVNQFTAVYEKVFGDALGENMVLGPQNPPRPAAGAIGSYASTNYELLPADASGNNHLNVWLYRSLFVDPPHDALLGERGARVLLGEALNAGSARALGSLFGLEKRAVQTYLLLGDPATPLNTGAPRLYATANSQPVANGVRYQPGAAGDSVVLAVDLVDESRLDDIQLVVTGEGARSVAPAEYAFSPDYPDTANGGGGRRYALTWTVRPEKKDAEFVISTRDRSGLAASFRLPLALEARLFGGGQPITPGDIAPASGTYQFVVSSPAQLVAEDLTLVVDGELVTAAIVAPAATDSSRRLWTVTWEGAYPTGSHRADVIVAGGATRGVTFNTSTAARVALKQVFAFPTPFNRGPVYFNFTLDSDGPVDILIKVYTVSGALVHQQEERGLNPGYHQVAWNGNDQRGDPLANGAYLFQVIAASDRGLHTVARGRLARVREDGGSR